MTPQTRRASAPQAASRGLVLLAALGLCGCASATGDVRDYYQQMAYNYKEAASKAKFQQLTLENQAKVQLATGDQNHYRRTQRELGRLKSWEEKCVKQEERFQKAAHWTEEHFHLPPGGKAVESGPGRRDPDGLRLEAPPASSLGTSASQAPLEGRGPALIE